MRLIVSDIPDEGLCREAEITIQLNDNVRTAVAHVSLRIFRFNRKVMIDGSASTVLSLTCSRCLNTFSLPLELKFKEEYNPDTGEGPGKEKELTRRDLDLSLYTGDEIDIEEIIKEQMLLAVPMKPLCRPDCRGICSRCGRDQNAGPCECPEEETDPRLAPLKRLKNTLKQRKE